MSKKRDAANRTAALKPAEPSPDRQERIAQRAYELYLARGGRDGRALDDWLDAERELADAA